MADEETAKLLAPREAARVLGAGVKTVGRWESQGLLEAARSAGGHRRYTAASVERLRLEREAGFLTAGQAAAVLRVGLSTPGRWADAGKLTGYRTKGGRRRFDPAEVQALLHGKAGDGP